MSKRTILLVDDDPDWRELVIRWAHTHQPAWTLQEAADLDEAVAVFHAHTIDLILLDVRGVGGWTTIDEFYEQIATVPVVLLTGMRKKETRQHHPATAYRVGFLNKDYLQQHPDASWQFLETCAERVTADRADPEDSDPNGGYASDTGGLAPL